MTIGWELQREGFGRGDHKSLDLRINLPSFHHHWISNQCLSGFVRKMGSTPVHLWPFKSSGAQAICPCPGSAPSAAAAQRNLRRGCGHCRGWWCWKTMAAFEERRVARSKEGRRGSYSTRTKPCVSEICRSGPYVWPRGQMKGRKGLSELGTPQHPFPNQAFPCCLDQSFIPVSSWSLSVFLYQRKANHPRLGERFLWEVCFGNSTWQLISDINRLFHMIPWLPMNQMKLYHFVSISVLFFCSKWAIFCHLEAPVAQVCPSRLSEGEIRPTDCNLAEAGCSCSWNQETIELALPPALGAWFCTRVWQEQNTWYWQCLSWCCFLSHEQAPHGTKTGNDVTDGCRSTTQHSKLINAANKPHAPVYLPEKRESSRQQKSPWGVQVDYVRWDGLGWCFTTCFSPKPSHITSPRSTPTMWVRPLGGELTRR